MENRLALSIVCPVLIGRAAPIDALRRRIDAIGDAGAQAVLIAGEAGIGKSRLVAEARAYATEQGLRVLKGDCFPQDRAYPYAPLLEMLRARFARQPPDAVAAIVRPFARELAPLLPEFVSIPPDLPPLPALDREQVQRRLFTAFAHCLTYDRQAPTLLLVEDLHWCDDSSLDALLYLLRSATWPLLLIGTYRDDEADLSLRQWLAELDRTRIARELKLARLTRAEVAAMIEAIFGAWSGEPVELRDAIYALAEGNPFYVEELLKALVAAGDLFHTGVAWESKPLLDLRIPRSLNAAIQQRLASLGAEARETLTLAAVIGRRFDFALLGRLARIDERELLRRIKELIAAQLVVEDLPDQFAFRHALTQQAIYGDLLTRERRALHLAVAEAIEQASQGAVDAHAADLAYHYFEARQWARALAYAGWAGEQAQRLHAPRTAIEQYTRALEAARQLGQPAAPNRTMLELAPTRLYMARGQAYVTLGQFAPARADYAAAIELAQATGDQQAECEALLDLGMLWSERDYAQAGDCYRRALDLARELGQPALIARGLNRVGNWYVNSARPHDALRLHQEALTIFERAQDRRGMAQTLDLLGMASHLSADRSASLGYYERAVALFRALEDHYGLVAGLVMRMSTRASTYYRDDMRADPASYGLAVRDGELALEQAQALDWRAGEAFALWAMGTLEGFHGEYGRALAATQRSRQVADEIGHQQWQAASHWTLGMIYLDLLELPAARSCLERALGLGKAIGSTFWVHQAAGGLAVVYLLDRQVPRADALLAALLDSAVPDEWGGLWLYLWARGRVALARRDPAGALKILDWASPPGADGIGRRDTFRVAHLRGEALMALGRAAQAEATLTHARDIAQLQGARSQLWRCHVALGNLFYAQKRFDDAQRAFTTARAVVAELAATVPDKTLRESFTQRAAERIPRRYGPSSRRARAAQFGGLTSREREVAALVGQGMSNREIAGALVLGERTVETHISNIFAKLNASSRHEVAAWAVEKGLVELG